MKNLSAAIFVITMSVGTYATAETGINQLNQYQCEIDQNGKHAITGVIMAPNEATAVALYILKKGYEVYDDGSLGFDYHGKKITITKLSCSRM